MALTTKPAKKKTLEIRLLYSKDLWAFNFFQKLSVYAALSISSDDPTLNLPTPHPHDHNRLRTPADKDGDGHPEWNHTLSLDLTDVLSSLPRDAYDKVFLRFDLFHEGGIFGDKRIGEVRVAFSEVIDRSARSGSVHIVSYQVKSPDGKPNGVLTFSYKLEGEEKDYVPIGGGFDSIGGFLTAHPLPEGSGYSSSEITYPKIDPEEFAVEDMIYYPPPGTHCHPPPDHPPLVYPMHPPPAPMHSSPGGCYHPAALQPMPAFVPWQHYGHHHQHVHHCSTSGGGGWWRM